jgi:hypothetical protein
MRLDDVMRTAWGSRKAFFSCAYDETLAAEDRAFQKATPTGFAEYVIDNPKATEQLVIGQYYYVDFTPVPTPAPAAQFVTGPKRGERELITARSDIYRSRVRCGASVAASGVAAAARERNRSPILAGSDAKPGKLRARFYDGPPPAVSLRHFQTAYPRMRTPTLRTHDSKREAGGLTTVCRFAGTSRCSPTMMRRWYGSSAPVRQS